MKRYESIKAIAGSPAGDELIIAANDMISRELYAMGDTPNDFHMLDLGPTQIKDRRRGVVN